MLHKKRTPYKKNKQKHITYVSLLLKNTIIGILSNYLDNYVNRVQYTVVKAIILF